MTLYYTVTEFADMADLLPPDSAARVLQNDATISLADAEAAWREHVDNQDAWRTLCMQVLFPVLTDSAVPIHWEEAERAVRARANPDAPEKSGNNVEETAMHPGGESPPAEDEKPRDGRRYNSLGMEVIDCGLCGGPTTMTGTKRCDRCWELEHRVKGDPALAMKVLLSMDSTRRYRVEAGVFADATIPRGYLPDQMWSVTDDGEWLRISDFINED